MLYALVAFLLSPSVLPPIRRPSSSLTNASGITSGTLKSYASITLEGGAEGAPCPFPACLARGQRLGHRLRHLVLERLRWPGIESTILWVVTWIVGAVFPQKPTLLANVTVAPHLYA